jgi:hypothetical protein
MYMPNHQSGGAAMKKNDGRKEILKMIHSGLRLNTPAPKRETPKKAYTRKSKHKRRFDTSSYFFPRMDLRLVLLCNL